MSLNKEQLEAVNAPYNSPLMVLAPAGSGKTTLLISRIERIANEGIPPHSIMAVTFTKKAAMEISERLEKKNPRLKGVLTGTFHSCAIKIMKRLRVEMPDCPLNTATYSIMDTDDQTKLVKFIMKQNPPPKDVFKDEKSLPKTIAGWISDRKEKAQRYRHVPVEPHNPATTYFRAIYCEYEAITAKNNMWDFAEILLRLYEELKANERTRKLVSSWFQHILVDEYQDSSPLNEGVVRLLLQDHLPITVVGDDDQSIYGWRGAENVFILNFPKRYSGAKIVTLTKNYRSTKHIINAANKIIGINTERHLKTMETDNELGEEIRVIDHYNGWDEGEYIANEIAAAIKSGEAKPEDFCIMFRTNAQSLPIETKLAELAIPYVMAKGLGFYDREEIKVAIAYLRLLNNPNDSAAFERVCSYPKRGIGEKKIASLRYKTASEGMTFLEALQDDKAKGCQELYSILERLTSFLSHPLDSLICATVHESGILEYFAKHKDPTLAERKVDNLNVLIEIAERNPEIELEDFLENVALTSEGAKKGEDGKSVTLSTIHGVKGLEFERCYIAGFSEGIFPHGQSTQTKSGAEEERRLAYVGITRAKTSLVLSHIRTDRMGNLLEPSSYIREAGLITDPREEERADVFAW